jgi:tetratricopeptide (TPR) repeat protein
MGGFNSKAPGSQTVVGQDYRIADNDDPGTAGVPNTQVPGPQTNETKSDETKSDENAGPGTANDDDTTITPQQEVASPRRECKEEVTRKTILAEAHRRQTERKAGPSLRRKNSLRSKLGGSGQHHKARSVRVFISSTFRDFAVERDYLMRVTLPILRAFCAEKGLTVVLVDLRWGVTEEESSRGDVIKLCLSEIDSCLPFFVGMLGDRYGWHLTGTGDEELLTKTMDIGQEDYAWIKDFRDRSVTEIEMLAGALRQKPQDVQAFFYIRNTAEFLQNEKSAIDADMVADKVFEAESQHAKDKQEQLRDTIRTCGYPFVEYSRVADMCNQLVVDLSQAIEDEWPGIAKITAVERLRLQHDSFAASRLMGYVASQEKMNELDDLVIGKAADASTMAVVTSHPGYGKTALLANWADQHIQAHQESLVVTHFIGTSRESSDYIHIVRRIVEELHERLELSSPVSNDSQALVDTFGEFLRNSADHARLKGGRIVLVLDGLDQLEDHGKSLFWLPRRPCPGLSILVSCNDGPVRDNISKRGWPTIDVPQLSADERDSTIKWYLAAHAKKLDGAQTQMILQHQHSENPLYLRTLLDEARLFGNFFQLTDHLKSLLEARNPTELFGLVLVRMGEDCGFSLVSKTTAHILASRDGLSDDELLASMNPLVVPRTPGKSSRRAGPIKTQIPRQGPYTQLVRSLRNQLTPVSGMLTFCDASIRTAVEKHCGDDALKSATDKLISYWQSVENPNDARRLRELPFLLERSQRWDALAAYLADPTIMITASHDGGLLVDMQRAWGAWERASSHESDHNDQQSRLEVQSSGGDEAGRVADSSSSSNDNKAEHRILRAVDAHIAVLRLESKLAKERLKAAGTTDGNNNDEGKEEVDPAAVKSSNGGRRGSVSSTSSVQSLSEEVDMDSITLIVRTIGSAAKVLETLRRLHHALHLRKSQLKYTEMLLAVAEERVAQCQDDDDDDNNNNNVEDEVDDSHGHGHREGDENANAGEGDILTMQRRRIEHNPTAQGDDGEAQEAPVQMTRRHSLESDVENIRAQLAVLLNEVAALYQETGEDYAESLRLKQRVLEMDEVALGKDHPKIAVALNNMASLDMVLGNFDRAKYLYRRALAIQTKASRNTDSEKEMAITLCNLASLCENQQEYDEAKDKLNQALALREQTMGSQHPLVGRTLVNLGAVEQASGNLEAATVRITEGKRILEETLEPGHPDLAWVAFSLASLRYDTGDIDAALPLYEEALQIRIARLGPIHIDVAATCLNIGSAYHEKWSAIEDEDDPAFEQMRDKAHYNYNAALEIFTEKLGAEHPDTASALHNLGTLSFEDNDMDAAEDYFNRALDIRSKKLGVDDAKTLNTKAALLAVTAARDEDAQDEDGEGDEQ